MVDEKLLIDSCQLLDGFIDDYYMDEKWAPSTSPEYLVSNKGRIYSNKTNKIMKEKKMDAQGHVGFSSINNGRRGYHYLHREMAMAFISNPNNYPIVRHLDDDKNNNSLENLAWGTQKDNHLDCVNNKTYYAITDENRRKGIEKTRTPIKAINTKNGNISNFYSQGEASRKLNIPQSNIYKVLKGERNKAKNYTFEYLKKGEVDECY